MIGRTPSHYRLTLQRGAGGMGLIYEAWDFMPEHSSPGRF